MNKKNNSVMKKGFVSGQARSKKDVLKSLKKIRSSHQDSSDDVPELSAMLDRRKKKKKGNVDKKSKKKNIKSRYSRGDKAQELWRGLQIINRRTKEISEMASKLANQIQKEGNDYSSQPDVMNILERKRRLLMAFVRGINGTQLRSYYIDEGLIDNTEEIE